VKRNSSQEIFIIAVFTLTVVSLWVYLSINKALHKEDQPVLSPQQTKVLNPTLDEEVFQELQKRKS